MQNNWKHLTLFAFCMYLTYSCASPDKPVQVNSSFDHSKPLYLECILDGKTQDTLYSLRIGLDSLADISFKVNPSTNITGSLLRAKTDTRGAFEEKISMRLQQLSEGNNKLVDSFYQTDEVVFAGNPVEQFSQMAGMNGDYLLMYDSGKQILINSLAKQDRLQLLFDFFSNYSGSSDIELVSMQIDHKTTRFYYLH